MRANLDICYGWSRFELVAALLDENPSDDRIKGFAAGFWEYMPGPNSFRSLVCDICEHDMFLFLDNGASSFLKDAFDQVSGESRYLIDLSGAVVEVENIEEFAAGIAGFQKAVFDFFQRKRGVKNWCSPASWHNLRYIDICNIDEEVGVYRKIFDDIGQNMEDVPCANPSKVAISKA